MWFPLSIVVFRAESRVKNNGGRSFGARAACVQLEQRKPGVAPGPCPSLAALAARDPGIRIRSPPWVSEFPRWSPHSPLPGNLLGPDMDPVRSETGVRRLSTGNAHLPSDGGEEARSRAPASVPRPKATRQQGGGGSYGTAERQPRAFQDSLRPNVASAAPHPPVVPRGSWR